MFFSKCFDVNRCVEMHKPNHWVKFQPRVSTNLPLNNWPQIATFKKASDMTHCVNKVRLKQNITNFEVNVCSKL